MKAHLVPLSPGAPALPPPDAVASCRLDAPGASWLLSLTERTGAYDVEDVSSRPGGGTACAALVEFDGPRDAGQVAADRRSHAERVWPAASQVDGVAGALVLRGADGAMVVVALAESAAAHAAAQRAILSTPLLPGEDPLLLRGPDRTTTCTVTADGVAAVLRGAAVTA